MNGLLFAASGAGPKPTLIMMHGLPGNERNLDLAQAVRRAGWNVLTFTYRGAWGSPGNFSIHGAVEDTAAALAYARSADGAALGIDPTRLVLAGHSMGGLTATLTAANQQGLAGLILLDAWNAGKDAATIRNGGAVARAEAIRGLDDLGNALQGATAEGLIDELIASGGDFDLLAAAPRLKNRRVLTVYARYGGGADNQELAAALRRNGANVSATELDSDHSFADHRIALAAAVISWLQHLPGR
jgi:pimeloyl-ACP methyl ester carboxylesterase